MGVGDSFAGFGWGSLIAQEGLLLVLVLDVANGESQYMDQGTQLPIGDTFTLTYPFVAHLEIDAVTGSPTYGNIYLRDNQDLDTPLLVSNVPDVGTLNVAPIIFIQSTPIIGAITTARLNAGSEAPQIEPTVGSVSQCAIPSANPSTDLVAFIGIGDTTVTAKQIFLEKLNGNNFSPYQIATIGSFVGTPPAYDTVKNVTEITLTSSDDLSDLNELDLGNLTYVGGDSGFQQLQFIDQNGQMELEYRQGLRSRPRL